MNIGMRGVEEWWRWEGFLTDHGDSIFIAFASAYAGAPHRATSKEDDWKILSRFHYPSAPRHRRGFGRLTRKRETLSPSAHNPYTVLPAVRCREDS
jgi:hypothetical protein